MPDLKHKMASERAAGLVPFHGTTWVSHDLRDDHSGVMWKVQGDGIVATWRVATVNSKRQRQKKERKDVIVTQNTDRRGYHFNSPHHDWLKMQSEIRL